MRLSGSPHPMTAFAIPPAAPPAVAEAHAEFVRIAALYEDAQDDLSDTRRAVVAAKASDVTAIVKATRDGKESKDPQKNERTARSDVERLESLLRGYAAAADEAGNLLAQQIDLHRDEWLKSLAEAAATIAASFDEIIVEARMTLAAFVPAQAGVQWVTNFDATQARMGAYSPFAGGRVRVSGRRAGVQALRAEYNPADLLTVAALATAPPTWLREKELSHA